MITIDKCANCGGKGWLVADTGIADRPHLELQRCDTCCKYGEDAEAIAAVEHSLLSFISHVADLPHEGEPDEQAQPFEPSSEDALATLNDLILRARTLLGTADTCSECGELVPYIMGCPDGRELCQDCFDAGAG